LDQENENDSQQEDAPPAKKQRKETIILDSEEENLAKSFQSLDDEDMESVDGKARGGEESEAGDADVDMAGGEDDSSHNDQGFGFNDNGVCSSFWI